MVDGTETDLVFHSDGDGTIHGIMDIMVGVGTDLTMVDIMEVTTVGTIGTDILVIMDMDTIVQEEFILNQVTEMVVV